MVSCTLTTHSSQNNSHFSYSQDESELLNALNDYVDIANTMTLLSGSLQNNIRQLRIQHTRLANSRTPALCLPPELMSYIFELACKWPSDLRKETKTKDFYQQRHTRGAISLTCSRWRHVAIETPALWSSIFGVSHGRAPPPPELVQLELQRAKGSNVLFQAWPTYNERAGLLAQLLHENINRLTSLYVCVTDACIAGCFDALGNGDLAVIQTLHIYQPRHDEKFAPLKSIDLSNASSLRELQLTSASWKQHITSVRLPSRNAIQRLSLDDTVPFQNALHLIQACNDLRTLSWSYQDKADIRPDHLEIQLPKLTSLNLGLTISSYVLESLVAHDLESIRIQTGEARALAAALPWIRDHTLFPNLRYMSLLVEVYVPDQTQPESVATYSTHMDQLVRFIQAHPKLEDVELPYIDIDPSLARCFGDTQSPDFNLRKLMRLTLYFGDDSSKHLTALLHLRRLGSQSRTDLPPFKLGCLTVSSALKAELDRLLEEYPGDLEYVPWRPPRKARQDWLWDHGFETYVDYGEAA